MIFRKGFFVKKLLEYISLIVLVAAILAGCSEANSPSAIQTPIPQNQPTAEAAQETAVPPTDIQAVPI